VSLKALCSWEAKLLFGIFAAFAEFERDLIRDRVLAGLTAARSRGRTGGRRPKLSAVQHQLAIEMARGGTAVATIAEHFGCARQTVYKALAQRRGHDHMQDSERLAI